VSPRHRSAQDRQAAAQARRAHRAEVTDADVVMEAAAVFLAVRPRSVAETRRRLRHLGYPPALCDEVVDRLVQLGYLDDRAFASAWVESRDRARPRGIVALRQELQQKGVARDIVDEILSQRSAVAAGTISSAADGAAGASGADVLAARRLLERRASALRREADTRRRRHKAYALLARHGFTPDVCQEVASGFADDGTGLTDEAV
jgi:regulatory protein